MRAIGKAFHGRAARGALVAVVALVVLAKWLVFMSGDRFGGDNDANIQFAYNLAYHGVFSDAEDAPRTPSNYREPLPPVVLAAFIGGLSAVDGPQEVSYFKEGRGAHVLRMSNIPWGVLLCLAVAGAIWTTTGSFVLSVLGAGLAGLGAEVNAQLTETAAAALIALFSLSLMLAVKNGRPRDWALTGLALGALILTKGAFQYVALVLLAALVAWSILEARTTAATRNGALLALGTLVVVAPWMARNVTYLETPQITQRAGIVLYTRALKNGMTAEERVGAVYVWAPRGLQSVIGALLGFGPDDLKKGGRLQRLNRKHSDFSEQDLAAEKAGRPEDAISYYRKVYAERTKIKAELRHQGVEQASRQADAVLQSKAMDMIRADPGRHLAMTPLFLWRGAPYEAPLFAVITGLALFWRRREFFAYVLPSLLMIAFYALLSHNIPRYNDPVFGVLLVAVLAVAHRAWSRRRSTSIADAASVGTGLDGVVASGK